MTKLTAAKIKNTTNRTYAICVAVPAMPDNPSNPAMIATTKNVTAQLSITDSFRQDRSSFLLPVHRRLLSVLEAAFDFLGLTFAVGIAKNRSPDFER